LNLVSPTDASEADEIDDVPSDVSG
jgi:hypothetical protein